MANKAIRLIWINPTKAIRHLISTKPGHGVLPLSVLYGIFLNVPGIFTISEDFELSILSSLLITVVLGGLLGLLVIYTRSCFLGLFARMFNLRAHGPNLRTAIAWSYIPEVVGLFLTSILVIVNYRIVSTVDEGSLTTIIALVPALITRFAFLPIGLISWIWTIILLIHTLAVVFHADRKRILYLLLAYSIAIEAPLHYLSSVFS